MKGYIYVSMIERFWVLIHVEFVNMWAWGERGAESVSFDDGSFGDFSDVGTDIC